MIELIHGDCINKLNAIEDNSIDMVLCDPPYGTTQCKWDSILPLELIWTHMKRIVKENGAIVFTASQPFTTTLIASNMEMFKYTWVWEKTHAKGHMNAKIQPLKAHEDVVVFYKKQCVYNPQMTHGHVRKTATRRKELNSDVYNKNTKTVTYDSTKRYPRTVQVFKADTQKLKLHPTQKPLALMEYLIKTYTNEGDMVLDFTMGSGTTGVACKILKREFIGIEMEKSYYKIAKKRIRDLDKPKVPKKKLIIITKVILTT